MAAGVCHRRHLRFHTTISGESQTNDPKEGDLNPRSPQDPPLKTHTHMLERTEESEEKKVFVNNFKKKKPQFRRISVLVKQMASLEPTESTIPDLLTGPVNIKWEEGAPALTARFAHTAISYNGAVYVGSGVDGYDEPVYSMDVYHPDTNKWDSPIETPVSYFAAVVLQGKLLIIGGLTRDNEVTNKVHALENGQWKDYTEMTTARCAPTAVVHHSMMIVAGGSGDDSGLCSTEVLDSSTGKWFKSDDLPEVLATAQSAVVGEMIYVLGGTNENAEPSTAVYGALLDTLSINHQLKWQRLKDTPCGNIAATGLNGKYLLAVGLEGDKREANELITLNPAGNSWIHNSTIPTKMFLSTLTCDGSKLLVIGGKTETAARTAEWEIEVSDKVWVGSFQ